MEFSHVSVLLNECISSLNIKPDGIYIDGTLGGAGHSLEICKSLSKEGKLVGIDQDENAIQKAYEVLNEYSHNIVLVRDNFSNIKSILKELNIDKVDGVLLDLGVSSHQLDEPERGFSYMHDAKLDMRMDTRNDLSAYEVVNNYSEEKITKIIQDYGEERWASRIAQFIVNERKSQCIETTFQLVSIIKKAIPKSARIDGPHPAKRTFQAIRIYVNNEINILEEAVRDIVSILKCDGRICIITFHSLEDRIIKNIFRDLANLCTCPRDFPVCVCGLESQLEVITRKPILPSESEIFHNNRARSAKLRVAKKII